MVGLIVAAYIKGFKVSHVVLSPNCRLAMLIAFAASFCIAVAIRESAKNYFDPNPVICGQVDRVCRPMRFH